ncbi:MAG: hypothetical protein R3B09_15530 [Nannocystaceae bacterium]
MSRSRQRAEFERLVATFAASSWKTWTARLQHLGDAGPGLAVSLLRAYRHGALTPERWARLTGGPPRDLAEIDDAIRTLWDELHRVGLADGHDRGSWSTEVTPGMLHRWAWQPRWRLVDQDEDLLLMSDALTPRMLEIAADRRVPKRDTIVAIVEHHARDTACQAVYEERPLAEVTPSFTPWIPLARAARANDLADYMERLVGYASPRAVDLEGAEQRLVDLGRCDRPPRHTVDVREAEGGFTGVLVHSAGDRRVHIAAATGEITRASPPGPGRGRKATSRRR